jgi:hypothetical protein
VVDLVCLGSSGQGKQDAAKDEEEVNEHIGDEDRATEIRDQLLHEDDREPQVGILDDDDRKGDLDKASASPDVGGVHALQDKDDRVGTLEVLWLGQFHLREVSTTIVRIHFSKLIVKHRENCFLEPCFLHVEHSQGVQEYEV